MNFFFLVGLILTRSVSPTQQRDVDYFFMKLKNA